MVALLGDSSTISKVGKSVASRKRLGRRRAICLPNKCRKQSGDTVVALREHRTNEPVNARLGSRGDVGDIDYPEAIRREYNIKRGNGMA